MAVGHFQSVRRLSNGSFVFTTLDGQRFVLAGPEAEKVAATLEGEQRYWESDKPRRNEEERERARRDANHWYGKPRRIPGNRL